MTSSQHCCSPQRGARHLASWRWRAGVAVVAASLGAGALLSPAANAALARVVVGQAVTVARAATAIAVPARTSFDVTLTPRHDAQLNALVAATADPTSSLYRHFLTRSQFVTDFAPSLSTVRRVEQYFTSQGLTVRSLMKSRLVLKVSGPSSDVATAFDARLHAVKVRGHVATLLASTATLPASVASSLTGLAGLTNALVPHTQQNALTSSAVSSLAPSSHSPRKSNVTPHLVSTPTTCPSANNYVDNVDQYAFTAQDQAALYGLASQWTNGINGSGETIGVYELSDYSKNDTNTYFNCYGLSRTLSSVNVDGGPTANDNGVSGAVGEADLDVEEAGVLAPGATIEVYEGTQNGQGPFDVYTAIANADVASVTTTSWGECELGLSGDTVSYNNEDLSVTAAENEVFTEMAAQGQTMVAASGDDGSSDCWGGSPDGRVKSAQVDDPSSQPDVTGVGGLTVISNTPGSSNEEVWNSDGGAGGGGESSLWSEPSWQTGTSFPIANRRMVPDLSVMADPVSGFIEYTGGQWTVIGGTSVAAPLVSALLATSEEACGGRYGLVNPTLYSIESHNIGFIDITEGNNALFRSEQQLGEYDATTGYDMASGLGSPNPNTFISSLCTLSASPALSTISTSSLTTVPDVALDATATVTVLGSTDEPLVHALPHVTGTEAGATVTVTPLSSGTNDFGQVRYSVATTAPGVVTLDADFGGVQIATTSVTFSSSVAIAPANAGALGLGAGATVSALTSTGVRVSVGTTASHKLVEMTSASLVVTNYSTKFHLAKIEGSPALSCSQTSCMVAFDDDGTLHIITNVNTPSSSANRNVGSLTSAARSVRAGAIAIADESANGYYDVVVTSTSGHVFFLHGVATSAAVNARNLTTKFSLGAAGGTPSIVAVSNTQAYVVISVSSTPWLLDVGTISSAANITKASNYSVAEYGTVNTAPTLTLDPGTNQLELLARTSDGALEIFSGSSAAPDVLSSATQIASSGVTAAGFVTGVTTSPPSSLDVLFIRNDALTLAVPTPAWNQLSVAALTGSSLIYSGLGLGLPLVLASGTDYQVTA